MLLYLNKMRKVILTLRKQFYGYYLVFVYRINFILSYLWTGNDEPNDMILKLQTGRFAAHILQISWLATHRLATCRLSFLKHSIQNIQEQSFEGVMLKKWCSRPSFLFN